MKRLPKESKKHCKENFCFCTAPVADFSPAAFQTASTQGPIPGVFADESAVFGFDTQVKQHNTDINGAFTAEHMINRTNPTALAVAIPHPKYISYPSRKSIR
ncbi:unnamed protein product [Bursaphelenchus xylophilus]|uniref:(pine wood nematode) hypothetical protein n=1 Tax=Bursaphelenchus xylophilus TaxID=6326 RepID=A0A1I7SPD7_BURXY|nr:unnamed protein product [Bursaphelenchus xylophilus]CAG9088569.1 unnamed protein product [Bursaphelenchus xylophilus]